MALREYIPLRALMVSLPPTEEGGEHPVSCGVGLPDGRIILLAFNGAVVASYSSEKTLQKYHPGAELEWQSDDINEAINHVDEEDV